MQGGTDGASPEATAPGAIAGQVGPGCDHGAVQVREAVVQRDGRGWCVVVDHGEPWPSRATQALAVRDARRLLGELGGGTVIVHDRRGRVRETFPVPTPPPGANHARRA